MNMYRPAKHQNDKKHNKSGAYDYILSLLMPYAVGNRVK